MDAVENQLLAIFLLFCRMGGCLLFAPGFSSPRVPFQVRLFIAVGVTASVSPLLLPAMTRLITPMPPDQQVYMILGETLTGAAIGLMARVFFLALQFAATAISNFIGLAGIPGIPLEEGDTGSPLATLVSSAATMIVLAMGLHVELLRAVIESYDVLKPGLPFGINALTINLVDVLAETSMLALRLAAPFLVYGVIVNFALGMGNRFAQQLSVYHATTGVVILGGFLLLYAIWVDWILVFTSSYQSWLLRGGL